MYDVDILRARLALAERVVEAARRHEESVPSDGGRCIQCNAELDCAEHCELRQMRDALAAYDAHARWSDDEGGGGT